MEYSPFIKRILNHINVYKPVIKVVPNKEWYDAYDGYIDDYPLFKCPSKILNIYKSKSRIKWSDDTVKYANYTLGSVVSVDDFFPNAVSCDSYGSAIVGRNYMILNSYACADEDISFPKFHLPIAQVCIISKDGVVEYMAVALNIRTLKFVVVKYIKRELPKSITDKYTGKDLFEHFGQKRAFWYDLGKDIISLRTTLELYDVTPEEFKQSDEYKDTLTYPRLLLSECRSKKIERILELENIV
jgi:hypothetical protein